MSLHLAIPDRTARATQAPIWIIETKGRKELDFPQKMRGLRQWCAATSPPEVRDQRYEFIDCKHPA
jgi:type III restriction enzyme